jgi:hypothetical protein
MEQTTMDKETLLSQMRASYERFETALDALTPEQWQARPAPDAWALKDTLAHITAWLERLVDAVDAALDGKEPQMPVVGLSDEDVDHLNAQTYAAHRDEAPQQLRGAFRMAYGQLADKLQMMTWDDLAAVGRFAWLGETPLWRIIAEDTWEHFEEHQPEVERAAQPGGQGQPQG